MLSFRNDRRLSCKKEIRSEEHTSELQSRPHLVCRLLLEKKKHYSKRYRLWYVFREYCLSRGIQRMTQARINSKAQTSILHIMHQISHVNFITVLLRLHIT